VESNEVRGEMGEWRAGVLVCFAVKEEAAEFRKLIPGADILVTGMGRENSEREIRRKLEMSIPSLVLTCGFAGALNPDLKVGDVVFDVDFGSGLAEILQSSGARAARIHCADRVAVTVAEKAKLRAGTGADAVEMESGVIREICREKKIPSATVRVISDAANDDLPLDFNECMTADQKISPVKLAMAIAKNPGAVPRLMELQRRTQFAAGELAQVLQKLLSRRHD
jgi:nucleoside phosphorylase